MLNTSQIRTFLTVAHTLSYIRAAELLYTTQPVVSYQIKALETELGVTLFNRTHRSVELTTAGSYFYQQVEPLMRQLETIVQTMQSMNAQTPKLINLLVRRLADYAKLTQIIKNYSESCPLVHVNILTQEDRGSRQLLVTGEVEMAFCYQFEVENDPKLKFLPLMESQYYVLVSKTHPLAAYKYLTFDDLSGQKLILANTELHRNPRLITRAQLKAKKIAVQTIYTSFDSMLIAVQSGIGFTILPCSRSKKFSGLLKIPLKDVKPVPLGIAWYSARTTPELESFIALAEKQNAEQPPAIV
ncbi:LysR family transcriptional regulator [Holdemania filiformis]|uniref:LysR family transcriptional regulator n=1 Tax=Holdemania filiformis TaxID=61171 RepID=UPI0024300EA8|nr:LysR family transcriptional regulator [Holdemania filiformis]